MNLGFELTKTAAPYDGKNMCPGTGQYPTLSGGWTPAGSCPGCYETNPELSSTGTIKAHSPEHASTTGRRTAANQTKNQSVMEMDRPHTVPMRPRSGDVRRPSTDQRKVRRQLARTAALECATCGSSIQETGQPGDRAYKHTGDAPASGSWGHTPWPTKKTGALADPGFGEIYGSENVPSYKTPFGDVWMWRKGQHVRFYTKDGEQVGPEQANVAPAAAYALSQGWKTGTNLDHIGPIGGTRKVAFGDPVAYTYEADMHCPSCALKRFGQEPGHPWVKEDATDHEGNPVHPVAPWDEMSEEGEYCGTCGAQISAPHREGSLARIAAADDAHFEEQMDSIFTVAAGPKVREPNELDRILEIDRAADARHDADDRERPAGWHYGDEYASYRNDYGHGGLDSDSLYDYDGADKRASLHEARATVRKSKQGGHTSYGVECNSCGHQPMYGMTYSGANDMADAHNREHHPKGKTTMAADVNYGGHPDDGGIALNYADTDHEAVYNGLGTDGKCEICGKAVLFDGFGPGNHMDPDTKVKWRHVVRASKTATVHEYGSTVNAYNDSQTNDAVKQGDVLSVPSEGVVGFMYSAWPTAVTEAHGEFHQLVNPSQGPTRTPDKTCPTCHGSGKAKETDNAPYRKPGDLNCWGCGGKGVYEGDKPEDVAKWKSGWQQAKQLAQQRGLKAHGARKTAIRHLTLTGPYAGQTLCGAVGGDNVHAAYAPESMLNSPDTCAACRAIWATGDPDADPQTAPDERQQALFAAKTAGPPHTDHICPGSGKVDDGGSRCPVCDQESPDGWHTKDGFVRKWHSLPDDQLDKLSVHAASGTDGMSPDQVDAEMEALRDILGTGTDLDDAQQARWFELSDAQINNRRSPSTSIYDDPPFTSARTASRIDTINQVLEGGIYGDDGKTVKLDGAILDHTSAQLLKQIYDALSTQEARDKFERLPLNTLMDFAWSKVKR